MPEAVPTFAAESARALALLCQAHNLPHDSDLIAREIGASEAIETVVGVAGRIGFKARLKQCPATEMHGLPVPFLAWQKRAPDDAAAPGTGGVSPALVIRCDRERVLYLAAGQSTPTTTSIDDFARTHDGRVMLAKPRFPAADTGAATGFGFGWFFGQVKRYRRIVGEVLLASLAIQMIALLTPLITQAVIDKVIAHQSYNTLLVLAVAAGVFVLFNAGLNWIRQYLVLHTGNRIDGTLGSWSFEHLLNLPLRYFEHRPTGTLTARLQGIESIRSFLTGALITVVLDMPFMILFAVVMFYYSWELSLVAIGAALLIAGLSLGITPLLRRRLNAQFMAGARNQAFVTEYVSGIETVKSLQLEITLSQRYGDYLAAYLAKTFDARRLQNSYGTIAGALEQASMLAILFFGAYIAMTRPDFTIGMLVAFQMFASRISGPLLRLASLWQEFQQASIAVARLGDILNAPTEPRTLAPTRIDKGQRNIAFEKVSFRYDEKLPLLFESLDFEIEAGTCVAIIGPSGSGKSTLTKLLQGYWQPSAGRILIGGIDIAHRGTNELRRLLGVVPQETTLFSGTLYDNLQIADPHPSFDRIADACRYADIHDFIQQLPDGYQTRIGEHGVGLSGGQKQRVAIARALLKRAPILVFDEATANLDGLTAAHLARTINRLRGKATLIFIAHHLPENLKVDRVLRMGGPHGNNSFSVLDAQRAEPSERRNT